MDFVCMKTFITGNASLAGYLIAKGFQYDVDERGKLFAFDAAATEAADRWRRMPRRTLNREKRFLSKHLNNQA